MSGQTAETKVQSKPSGVFAEIARRNEEIRSDKSLDLWIPGYEGMIKVRYRLLGDTEMDELVERASKVKPGDDGGVAADRRFLADGLVRMCECIIVREDGTDLTLEDDKGPVRFDRRFAALIEERTGIQVDGETATEIMENFFCPLTEPDNPASPRAFPNAIARHNSAVISWYQGERDSIEAELLGN